MRLTAVSALFLFTAISCSAQDNQPGAPMVEPRGSYVQLGLSTLRGAGAQIGYVNTHNFYTSEVSFLIDLLPALKPDLGTQQLAFTLGGAVRLFGFERTIGNTPYRGYDVDVGFRAGPGLSFSTNETRATRNQRFTLFIEPFLRYSRRFWGRQIYYLEVGTIRPHIRIGAWLTL